MTVAGRGVIDVVEGSERDLKRSAHGGSSVDGRIRVRLRVTDLCESRETEANQKHSVEKQHEYLRAEQLRVSLIC